MLRRATLKGRSLSRQQRSGSTADYFFSRRCVSVADQICNCCRCPAFAKHQDANVERFVAATHQARPTEQQPIISDQEGGSKKSQPDSKEFRSDGAERSAVTFFRSRRSYHQQLTKSEDRS